ncbi:MAG: hypothetical protein ABIH71_00285 [Candidatus Omnitrophota bacterium]|nr:hypothetical protein [Candidatus Omnitrophota bacterium]
MKVKAVKRKSVSKGKLLEFNLERFSLKYDTLLEAKGKLRSKYFKEFILKSYPVKYKTGEVNPRNVALEKLLDMGYRIRTTEDFFKRKTDAFGMNEEGMKKVVNSQMSDFQKIVKIMYVMDVKGERVRVGGNVEQFSVVGVDNINKFIDLKIDEFYKMEKNKVVISLPTKDVAWEVIRNTVVIGYYFKVAEDILRSLG